MRERELCAYVLPSLPCAAFPLSPFPPIRSLSFHTPSPPSLPPLPWLELSATPPWTLLHALTTSTSVMIILDGVDDPGIKACNASIDPEDPPVARATTPSPSLPDYEASQAQLNKEPSSSSPSSSSTPLSRRRKKSRFWRFAIYGLLIYFLLTITIGIPILVTVSFTFF